MNANGLQFHIAGAISRDKRLHKLVLAAHQTLGDLMESSRAEIKEDWSLEQDPQGRTWIHLVLSDSTGRSEARFTPEELEDPDQIGYRLYEAWDDLLQVRTHQLLRNLTGTDDSKDGADGP